MLKHKFSQKQILSIYKCVVRLHAVHTPVFATFPANIPLPQSRNDSVEVANQKRLLRTLEQLTNRLKRTLAKQPLSSFHVSSQMIVADPKSLESKKAFLSCRPGSMLRGRMCGEHRRQCHPSVPHLSSAAFNNMK